MLSYTALATGLYTMTTHQEFNTDIASVVPVGSKVIVEGKNLRMAKMTG